MKSDIIIKLLSHRTPNHEWMGDDLYNSQINDHFRESNWFYLHGKLEDNCGYDRAIIINYNEIETKETINWETISGDKVTKCISPYPVKTNYLNGIYKVEIKDIEYPCTGYFWTTNEHTVYDEQNESHLYWEQRGLVVADDDKEAVEYALNKYKTKAIYL